MKKYIDIDHPKNLEEVRRIVEFKRGLNKLEKIMERLLHRNEKVIIDKL